MTSRFQWKINIADDNLRRILKRGKGTSEEGFKLGLFWELEKMATFYYNKKE
jgi:hypothetical protein